jgi:hypothetical protein
MRAASSLALKILQLFHPSFNAFFTVNASALADENKRHAAHHHGGSGRCGFRADLSAKIPGWKNPRKRPDRVRCDRSRRPR